MTFSTLYYYLAMAEDIILRLLWVVGLILKQVQLHRDHQEYKRLLLKIL